MAFESREPGSTETGCVVGEGPSLEASKNAKGNIKEVDD
jgi:hypothetical protein